MATTGMPWFRVNPDWEEHPKVQDFCDAIRQPMGSIYVMRLWGHTARFYPNGAITTTGRGLERALKWKGKSGELVAAMVRLRLLDGEDGSFTPHDWEEHNGAAYRKWEADRNRRKNPKGSLSNGNNNPSETSEKPDRVSVGSSSETARNPIATVRNGTVRNGIEVREMIQSSVDVRDVGEPPPPTNESGQQTTEKQTQAPEKTQDHGGQQFVSASDTYSESPQNKPVQQPSDGAPPGKQTLSSASVDPSGGATTPKAPDSSENAGVSPGAKPSLTPLATNPKPVRAEASPNGVGPRKPTREDVDRVVAHFHDTLDRAREVRVHAMRLDQVWWLLDPHPDKGGRSADVLCRAIDGYAVSPWHRERGGADWDDVFGVAGQTATYASRIEKGLKLLREAEHASAPKDKPKPPIDARPQPPPFVAPPPMTEAERKASEEARRAARPTFLGGAHAG